MSCRPLTITLDAGATYQQVYRWGAQPLVYKQVTAVTAYAPLTMTVAGHGVPAGWAIAVNDFASPLEVLNASAWPPVDSDFDSATVIDANTLSLNDVDATGLGTYTSGGVIAYYTPVDLAGYSGVFNIYSSPPTASPPVPVATGAVTFDNTAKTITITITPATSAPLGGNYTYTLVLTDGSGVVTFLDEGKLVVRVPGST